MAVTTTSLCNVVNETNYGKRLELIAAMEDSTAKYNPKWNYDRQLDEVSREVNGEFDNCNDALKFADGYKEGYEEGSVPKHSKAIISKSIEKYQAKKIKEADEEAKAYLKQEKARIDSDIPLYRVTAEKRVVEEIRASKQHLYREAVAYSEEFEQDFNKKKKEMIESFERKGKELQEYVGNLESEKDSISDEVQAMAREIESLKWKKKDLLADANQYWVLRIVRDIIFWLLRRKKESWVTNEVLALPIDEFNELKDYVDELQD